MPTPDMCTPGARARMCRPLPRGSRGNLRRWMLGMALWGMCVFSAHAELVVIVGVNSSVTRLTREQIVNIFMGRYRKLPDGADARPLDLGGESPERREFYQRLLDKSLAEINAYWARLVFSGKTVPPLALSGPEQVLQRVSQDPAAIGYVQRYSLDDRARVVFSFPEELPPNFW